jgi:ClpP class serine protease
MLLDASRHYEMEGIKHDPVYNGEFKLAGASFKPLTDAERAMFQAQVDKTASQFKAIVKAGHDVADEFLEGQVYDGEDAERINMVDSIVMDIQEVVDLVKMAAFDSV